MKLKQYTVAVFFLLLFIGIYVFSQISSDTFATTIFGYYLKLPVAIWVLLPAIILFVASFLHMFFHGIRTFFRIRSFTSDYRKMIKMIKAQILGKEEEYTFKTNEFNLLSKVVKESIIDLHEDFHSGVEEIDDVAKDINNVRKGMSIKIKKYNLADTNPLVQKNILNKIETDDTFAVDVLKKPNAYSLEFRKHAYIKVLKSQNSYAIKEYLKNVDLDKEILFLLLDEFKESVDFEINEIKEMLSKVDLDKNEYIEVASKLKRKINPDELIAMFEQLQVYDEDSIEALFYVLFDLEMIDRAKEILDLYNKNDYIRYRAFLFLKKSGFNYSIDNYLGR